MKASIKDFIPIILIYLLICVPGKVVPISHTHLGRFIAVLLIVFYAKMDVVLGLVVCVAVIYYYQMEEYEYMLNMTDDELWAMTYEEGTYGSLPLNATRSYAPSACGFTADKREAFKQNPPFHSINEKMKPMSTVSNSLLSGKLDTEQELMRKRQLWFTD